ncbi:MAG: NAD(P)/FAD-dependent oxidoreductase [Acidimicrobiales bacterium]
MSLPKSRDVVVVGGGILGLASAYELARRGLSVLVIESYRTGAAQSGLNLGFVRQQGRDPAELPLMMAANRRWRSLSAELGADTEWVMGGNLRLTKDGSLAVRYEEWVRLASSIGLDSRVVTGEEVNTILCAETGGFEIAIFTPSDGHADPVATCAAYASAARCNGAEIVEGVAVTGLERTGSRISGVSTAIGEVRARAVVVAAGAGSARLCRSVGVRFPQRLVRQSVVLTEPVKALTKAAAWTGELFVRQDVQGRLRLAGATRNEIVLDPGGIRDAPRFLASYFANRSQLRIRADRARLLRAAGRSLLAPTGDAHLPVADPEDIIYCLRTAARMFPALAELRLQRAWAGEIDSTPDALAVLDAPVEHPGLVLATAMSGHGFGLSPAVGSVVAALVAGEEPGFDLRPFRLARFHDGSHLEPAHLL